MRRWSVLNKESWDFLFNCPCWYFLHARFEGFHCMFCRAIRSGVVWGWTNMMNAIGLDKFLEFSTGKHWAIVRHQSIWQSMSSKNVTHFLDGFGSSDTIQGAHFDPIRVCTNDDEKHYSKEWPCRVNVNATPWLFRPIPRIQRCWCCVVPRTLTLITSFWHWLQITIDFRPPHITSSCGFHTNYSSVLLIQKRQNCWLEFGGNDDMRSSEHTAVIDA